jgi:cellulose synthase/poly-beta-1,6-N-acetylglucosamine synthase-like glycosyltransferase
MMPLIRTRLDRWAMPLGLLGLPAVADHNWRLWRRDRAFLAARPAPEALPPLNAWPELPLVSVLAAAWNEAAHIDGFINSFLALRYAHKELALCAGGEDGTYEHALRRAGPLVKVLRQEPGEGKQRALARAFAIARGAIIFLTDADCLLADEPFERTLRPVVAAGDLAGDEQAATGGSQPFDRQLSDPFVFSQAATQLYAALHGPEYTPGILGRNAAVHRSLLMETGALDVPAPTGTDYVLAKTLLAAGARIRHVPDSLMPTECPATAREYVRQQSRWLKNLLLVGYRFRDWFHVRAALVSIALGFAMLGLPLLLPLAGPAVIWLYLVLWTHTILARLRYVGFYRVMEPKDASDKRLLPIVRVALADYLAAVKAAFDVLMKNGRSQW